jgi:uncharacterized membrane protein
MACAWGGVAGYGVAMLLSYFVGQKKMPINYPLLQIGKYVLIAAVLYTAMALLPDSFPAILRIGINTLLIAIFVAYIIKADMPLHSLPVIGKYFK